MTRHRGGAEACRVAAATAILALVSWTGLVASVPYQLVKDHSGSAFFDGWDFYGNIDNLTWGNVTWVSQGQATSLDLAYVNPAGNAILKVDNTTVVLPGQLRNSVRITTQDQYNFGTVWIADILHLPYGCSVWPAYWTTGPLWPDDGEIDIIEGINGMSANQMALHTLVGCTAAPGVKESGTLGEADCSTPSGCVVGENQPASYGAGFAAAGGGVWATRFDTTGVYIWFWSRANVPTSIATSTSTSSVDDSDWGTPSAGYSSVTCDMATFFKPQKVIFDITLCGIWAGIPSLYVGDCSVGNGTTRGGNGSTSTSTSDSVCYDNSVVGDGSNFNDAYFEIKHMRIYTDVPVATSTVVVVTSAGTTPTQGGASPPTSSSTAAKSGTLNSFELSGARIGTLWMLVVLVMLCMITL